MQSFGLKSKPLPGKALRLILDQTVLVKGLQKYLHENVMDVAIKLIGNFATFLPIQ